MARQLFQQIAQFIVAHIDVVAKILHQQRTALRLRIIEQQQDFQHIVKAPLCTQMAAESLALPIRQRSGKHRAGEHQHPQ